MLKRVKKLVKGHKKTKEKSINALGIKITNHSFGDCVVETHTGIAITRNSNFSTTTTTPSLHVTDHSTEYDSEDGGSKAGRDNPQLIIPPSIEITDHSSDNNDDDDDVNDNDNADNHKDNSDNDNGKTNVNVENNRLSSTINDNNTGSSFSSGSNGSAGLIVNMRCASSSALNQKNTNNSHCNQGSSKEKIKKRKSSQQLQLPPEGLRIVSKSTGDLSHLLNPNRRASTPSLGRPMATTTGGGSARGSVESIRENRLSVMSKLDEYIDHFKKSVDEDRMAYAANRLCCAQILLKVYQKREQQYIYDSLHPTKPQQQRPLGQASQGQQQLLCPSTGNFNNLKNTSSCQNFVQGQGRHRRRVSWQQQGSESNTSLSDDPKDCKFRIGGGYDTSDSDPDSDGHENNESGIDSNASDIDFSKNDRSGNSLTVLKSNMKQRSVPLFKVNNQKLDIY